MTQEFDMMSELEDFDDEGLYGPDDVTPPATDNDGPDVPDGEDDELPTKFQYCLTQQFVAPMGPMMLDAPPHDFGEGVLAAEDWQLQTYEFSKLQTEQGALARAIAVLWVREVTFDPDAIDEPTAPPAPKQPAAVPAREFLPVQGAPPNRYPTGNPADTALNAPGSPGGGPVGVTSASPAGVPAGGSAAVRVVDRGQQPLPEDAALQVAAAAAEVTAKLSERGVQVKVQPGAAPPAAPAAPPPQVVVAHSSGGPAPKARKAQRQPEPAIDVKGEAGDLSDD